MILMIAGMGQLVYCVAVKCHALCRSQYILSYEDIHAFPNQLIVRGAGVCS